jgi:hypothetical protein
MKTLNRQARANIAARHGGIKSQREIDEMWSGIVQSMNEALPVHKDPIGARRAAASESAPERSQVVDWSAITASINREAGLKTPARSAGR